MRSFYDFVVDHQRYIWFAIGVMFGREWWLAAGLFIVVQLYLDWAAYRALVASDEPSPHVLAVIDEFAAIRPMLKTASSRAVEGKEQRSFDDEVFEVEVAR